MKKITNKNIMDRLGKSENTFYKWKQREPETVELVRLGMTLEAIAKKVSYDNKLG
jgi:transposase